MGGVKFHTKGQYDQNLTESGTYIKNCTRFVAVKIII